MLEKKKQEHQLNKPSETHSTIKWKWKGELKREQPYEEGIEGGG